MTQEETGSTGSRLNRNHEQHQSGRRRRRATSTRSNRRPGGHTDGTLRSPAAGPTWANATLSSHDTTAAWQHWYGISWHGSMGPWNGTEWHSVDYKRHGMGFLADEPAPVPTPAPAPPAPVPTPTPEIGLPSDGPPTPTRIADVGHREGQLISPGGGGVLCAIPAHGMQRANRTRP